MHGVRKLDVGNPRPGYDGYETCDIRDGADSWCNATSITLLGKFDEILCSMVLEHLSPWEIPVALKEFYNALNDGGFVDISVPDFASIVELFKGNPTEALRRLFGGSLTKDGEDDCSAQEHRWAFTNETLCSYLRKAGFTTMRNMDAPYGILWIRAWK